MYIRIFIHIYIYTHRAIAIKLYTALASCSKRMGNPSNVLSADIIIATPSVSCSMIYIYECIYCICVI